MHAARSAPAEPTAQAPGGRGRRPQPSAPAGPSPLLVGLWKGIW